MPLVALDYRQPIIDQRRPLGFRVAIAVAINAVEVGQELLQDVRGWDEVGIEHRDELGPRIGDLEGLLQRPTLEAGPALSAGDLHPAVAGPTLVQDAGGL